MLLLFVVCGIPGLFPLPLLLRVLPFLQPDEPSHIGRETYGFPESRGRRLEAAVPLVGRHLMDADGGFGLTDQRNLSLRKNKRNTCVTYLEVLDQSKV